MKIVARELTKTFGATVAVDRVSVAVARGELFGLVGPDGAGKTTTLRMLAGILTPTSGDAEVAGHSVTREPERLKQRIGYMSQRFGLYGDLTVAENLAFYADLFEVRASERGPRVERLLAASNLAPFTGRLADQLSGGMRQKLALACALVHTPEILLLDEPTNGVDPVSRRDFWRLLYDMLKDGVTIVVTTAYLDEAERCNRVGLMHRGRLLAVDAPDRLKRLESATLVEIPVADGWAARERLRAVPAALRVTLFGHRLHVVLADPEEALVSVMAALGAPGIGAGEPRLIVPSLEDVFISRLERDADRAPVSGR